VQTPDIAQLQSRVFYHHWHSIDVRIADLDDQRHVNNAVFAVYCEEGRRKFWEPSWPLIRAEKVMTFIARLSIDFHREMGYPGRVDVGTAIKRIGNSSYTMAQALFIDQECHATIEVVSVIAAVQTRKPIPIPDSLRAHLQQNLGG
jgi:acyl-CoA thioester hydrolase